MSDLAHLKVWADPAIRDSLLWYLDVAENRRPAKFRIAATLATHLDPTASSEEALWAELDRLTPIFMSTLAGDPDRRAVAGNGRWTEPAGSMAANLLIACSPTAISVPGIVASTAWRCQIRCLQTRFGFASECDPHHPGLSRYLVLPESQKLSGWNCAITFNLCTLQIRCDVRNSIEHGARIVLFANAEELYCKHHFFVPLSQQNVRRPNN